MKVIIFDFDGTIADSFQTVLNIANRLAVEFGYPTVPPEDVEYLQNLSSREILQRSNVPLFKLPFLLLRLRRELNHEIRQLALIPGLKEALLELRRRGDRLAIVTSNSRENVAAFLEAQGLADWFDFIGSGLTLLGKGRILRQMIRRHQLDLATVIYVGDETRDIEAAHRVSLPVIAVSWGFNSHQVLAAHHPDRLIRQPQELVEAVEAVVSAREQGFS